jgi:hypothetical protein
MTGSRLAWSALLMLVGSTAPAAPLQSRAQEQAAADLAEAIRLWNQDLRLKEAIALARRVADDAAARAAVRAEARFWEAHLLDIWPPEGDRHPAARAFLRVLDDFPRSAKRGPAAARLVGIAHIWLDATHLEMEARRTGAGAQPPRSEAEGSEAEAVVLLERAYAADPNGPGAALALSLLGNVALFRGDHMAARRHFERLTRDHPNSPFAEDAREKLRDPVRAIASLPERERQTGYREQYTEGEALQSPYSAPKTAGAPGH